MNRPLRDSILEALTVLGDERKEGPYIAPSEESRAMRMQHAVTTLRRLLDNGHIAGRNSARHGYTVGELIATLAGYDPALPVRFTSSECGGRWPDKGWPMGVFTSHQVSAVRSLTASLQTDPARSYLGVFLLAVDKADVDL